MADRNVPETGGKIVDLMEALKASLRNPPKPCDCPACTRNRAVPCCPRGLTHGTVCSCGVTVIAPDAGERRE